MNSLVHLAAIGVVGKRSVQYKDLQNVQFHLVQSQSRTGIACAKSSSASRRDSLLRVWRQTSGEIQHGEQKHKDAIDYCYGGAQTLPNQYRTYATVTSSHVHLCESIISSGRGGKGARESIRGTQSRHGSCDPRRVPDCPWSARGVRRPFHP